MRKLRGVVEPADHVVFVLVDGLGMNLQSRFPPGGFFSETLKMELRAIFPSTTAAALTTLASGAWPADHSITGWWTYFSEHNRTLCPLTFRERVTDTPAEKLGLSLSSLIPVQSMYPAFFRHVRSHLPARLIHGEYGNWSRGGTRIVGYQSAAQLVRRVTRAIRHSRNATFSYVYTTEVDGTIHKTGTVDERVAEAIRTNDNMLTRLRDSLPDSVRIVATADHGLVDVPDGYTFKLRDDHPLMNHLLVPPSGEGSAPIFHLRTGHHDAFLDDFTRAGLAENFALITPENAEELRLYGPDPLGERMREHLGNYIGIARDPHVLEYVPAGRDPIGHRGVHGGLRPAEMRTGLFCI
jgi:hypothetical protein